MRFNPDTRWFSPVTQLVRLAALALAAALIWHTWQARSPRDWPTTPVWTAKDPSVEELHVRSVSQITRERLEDSLNRVAARAEWIAALPEIRDSAQDSRRNAADRAATQAILGEPDLDLITVHSANGELRGFNQTDRRGLPALRGVREAIATGFPAGFWHSPRWLDSVSNSDPGFELLLKWPIGRDSRSASGPALCCIVPIRDEASGQPIGALGAWVFFSRVEDLLPRPDRNVHFALVAAGGQLISDAPIQGSLAFPFTPPVVRDMVGLLNQANTDRGTLEWASYTGRLERVAPDLLDSQPVYVLSYANSDWLRFRDRQIWTIAILGALALSLLGLIGLSLDWSRRQHDIAVELRQAKLQAEQAAAVKGQFLCHMSHEVRTPIGAVLGYLDLLEVLVKPSSLAAKVLPILSRAKRNARQMLGLCEELLEMAGSEPLDSSQKMELVSPLTLARECVQELEPAARRKGLAISVLESGEPVGSISTDPARLMLVLRCIIGNAIKFTSVGSVQITLSRANDQLVEISISDTGPGLSPDALTHLYQPFWQGDSSMHRSHEGLGLGLARSKHHVDVMGGSLRVESQPGIGTAVTICLKAESAQTSAPAPVNHAAAVPKPAEPATAQQLNGLRILVVDDHDDNQDLMRFYLESAGATVDIASGGQAALDMLASTKSRPDMVFMDMQMPGVDGYSATEQLRRRGDRIPVVALTAHATAEDRERCLNCGCTAYLSKPATPATILAAVAQMCQQYA